MNKYATTLLVGSLAFTGMSLAQADADMAGHAQHQAMACHHEHAEHDRGDRLQRLQAHLNLSDAQVKQIGDIYANSSTESESLRKAMRENRQQLHALMQSDNPEEAKIRALAEAQGRTQADMLVLHSRQRTAINQVLTPEQRSKMHEHFRSQQHHAEGDDKQS